MVGSATPKKTNWAASLLRSGESQEECGCDGGAYTSFIAQLHPDACHFHTQHPQRSYCYPVLRSSARPCNFRRDVHGFHAACNSALPPNLSRKAPHARFTSTRPCPTATHLHVTTAVSLQDTYSHTPPSLHQAQPPNFHEAFLYSHQTSARQLPPPNYLQTTLYCHPTSTRRLFTATQLPPGNCLLPPNFHQKLFTATRLPPGNSLLPPNFHQAIVYCPATRLRPT